MKHSTIERLLYTAIVLAFLALIAFIYQRDGKFWAVTSTVLFALAYSNGRRSRTEPMKGKKHRSSTPTYIPPPRIPKPPKFRL
jgi:hypothetical protein